MARHHGIIFFLFFVLTTAFLVEVEEHANETSSNDTAALPFTKQQTPLIENNNDLWQSTFGIFAVQAAASVTNPIGDDTIQLQPKQGVCDNRKRQRTLEYEAWTTCKTGIIIVTLGIGGLLLLLGSGMAAQEYASRSVFTLLVLSLALMSLTGIFELERTTTRLADTIIGMPQNLLGWYLAVLESSPMVTKSLTTALIQFVGDFIAQVIEQSRIISSTTQQKRFKLSRFRENYDLRRGLSLAVDGLLLSGPLLHYVYEWLEDALPTSDSSVSAVIHVFVNDFLVDTFYLFLSFIFVTTAEGHWRDLKTIFQKDFVNTVKASWGSSLGFMPIEFISFRYLPVHFRVLAMNFVDIIWGAIISFTAHRSRNEMKESS